MLEPRNVPAFRQYGIPCGVAAHVLEIDIRQSHFEKRIDTELSLYQPFKLVPYAIWRRGFLAYEIDDALQAGLWLTALRLRFQVKLFRFWHSVFSQIVFSP